jgi:uncharacterized protein YjbJ (UPF0337 family)
MTPTQEHPMTDTTDQSQGTADQAKAAASETAGKAAEQGKEVARAAASQATEVKEHAKEQLGNVTDEAKNQAQKVLSTTTSEVEAQLEQRLGDAATLARTTAGELQALADGRPEDAGRSGELVRQAGQRLEHLADRADELGVRGVAEEAADLARRRPVAFLAGAVATGFLVGRIARAGREVQSSSSSTSTPPSSTRPETTTPNRQLRSAPAPSTSLGTGLEGATSPAAVDPPVDGSTLGITSPLGGPQS